MKIFKLTIHTHFNYSTLKEEFYLNKNLVDERIKFFEEKLAERDRVWEMDLPYQEDIATYWTVKEIEVIEN